jgi:hypothetical protein
MAQMTSGFEYIPAGNRFETRKRVSIGNSRSRFKDDRAVIPSRSHQRADESLTPRVRVEVGKGR